MPPLTSATRLFGGKRSKAPSRRTRHLHRGLFDPVWYDQDSTQIEDHVESLHLNDIATSSIHIQLATLDNEIPPISTHQHQAYNPPRSKPIRFREECPPRFYRWKAHSHVSGIAVNSSVHNYWDAVDDYGLDKRWVRTKSEPPKPSWDAQRSYVDNNKRQKAAVESEPRMRREETQPQEHTYMEEQSKDVQTVLNKVDPKQNTRDGNIGRGQYDENGRKEACRYQTPALTKENVYNSVVSSDSGDADDEGDDEGDDERDIRRRRLVMWKTMRAMQIPRASPWVLAGTI